MRMYEKPQICFEKLVLFEKIADRCWAGETFKFVSPFNENEGNITIIGDKDCGKNECDDFWAQVRLIINNDTKYYEYYNHKENLFIENTKKNWAYTTS